MVMEGRCAVETLNEFGFSSVSSTLIVGSNVFICTGDDEVYAFNDRNRELKASLDFTFTFFPS